MTSYTLPVFYNSGLKFILADPRFSRLVYNSNDAVQLYELRSSVQISQKKLKKIDLLQEPYIWTNSLFITILNMFSLKINYEFYDKKSIENTFAYFTVRKLVLNKITKNSHNVLLIEEPGEYIISLNLAGEGYVKLWMENNNFFDRRKRKTLLGDFALSPTKPKIEFLRRVKFEDKNTYISLSIEHKGSRIKIEKIILEQLSLDPKILN
jgi:hypothetical protein